MQMRAKRFALIPALFVLVTSRPWVHASDTQQSVEMYAKNTQTFYVSGRIHDSPLTEFMVDTGSSYMTINEDTLALLNETGQADYIKEVSGILANGARIPISIYSIPKVEIGANCILNDVEVAVFPGRTRQILGLSALLKAAPFVFSVDPPRLTLSHCGLPIEDGEDSNNLAAVDNP